MSGPTIIALSCDGGHAQTGWGIVDARPNAEPAREGRNDGLERGV